MERRFDMTDFEQSLRDHADQFTMVPSKRVWNGIYNNLHPGSRWPSITVALILVITLIGIGHFNNTPRQMADNSVEKATNNNTTKNQSTNKNSTSGINYLRNKSTAANDQLSTNADQSIKKSETSDFIEKDFFLKNNKSVNNSSLKIIDNQHSKFATGEKVEKENSTINAKASINENNKAHGIIVNNSTQNNLINLDLSQQKLNAYNNNDLKSYVEKTDFLINNTPNYIKNNKLDFTINPIQSNDLLSLFLLNQVRPTEINVERNSEEKIQSMNNISGNKENKTGSNKPLRIHKKRNPKINWVYYVAPTVSTVTFRGKEIQPPATASQNLSPIIVQSNQYSKNMLYNARLSYAVGTQMTYSFSNKIQFLTGINLNHSGYHIISNQVHPTFAYLMLRDESSGRAYAKSYITHYGNGQGQNQISLSNSNLQLSIPVGLQYVLWGNNTVQISMASSLEPSIVLKSNSYIISSDGRNYINDPDLLRKLNIAGNFGSYVTFTSKKIKWQVGPSVRYQLLSTYQKIYPVKEHLIDYGIRIGISR